MFCGFRRTPPGWPARAGRLAALSCVLVFLLAGSVTPASAYVCSPTAARGRSVAAQNACARSRERSPVWRKKGDADAMSFVFFIGAVVAVLLIPVALGRREELPPE